MDELFFKWLDGDWVRGRLTAAARDRYLAHCLAVGSVTTEAIDDNLVSEADLVARGWALDFLSDTWRPRGAE